VTTGWGDLSWGSNGWGGDVPTYNQAITGVAAAGNVGAVGPGKAAAISGVLTSGNVGSMVPTRFVEITGTTASGTLGTFGYYYWTAIDDTQNPNWTEITNF
jgi:hypothetical protein